MQINSVTLLSNNSKMSSSKINNNSFAKTNLMSNSSCDCVDLKKSKEVNFSGKTGGIVKLATSFGIMGAGALASIACPVISVVSLLGAGVLAMLGGREITDYLDEQEKNEKNIEAKNDNINEEIKSE